MVIVDATVVGGRERAVKGVRYVWGECVGEGEIVCRCVGEGEIVCRCIWGGECVCGGRRGRKREEVCVCVREEEGKEG